MTAGSAAAAGPAFSPGWFADKRARRRRRPRAGCRAAALPEYRTRNESNSARRAAATVAGQPEPHSRHDRGPAIGRPPRQAALNGASAVPDGMAEGGLKVDRNPLTAGWENAKALTDKSQAQVNGRTVVTVEQTGERAILNWETFNVGRQTTVAFKQEASWAVLNRVNDPKARPSQIQGQIDAAGTVMVVNRNGIVFSGTSRSIPATGRRRGGHERCAVQAGHLQREGGQRGPGADDAGLRQRSGRRDAATFSKATGDVRVEAARAYRRQARVGYPGRRLRAAPGAGDAQCRSDHDAGRPDAAGRRRQLHHPQGTGVRRQQHIDDPWQRGVRAPQGRQ